MKERRRVALTALGGAGFALLAVAIAVSVAIVIVILVATGRLARAAETPAAFDPGPPIRAAVEAHFGHWDAERRASFADAWSAYESVASRDAGDPDALDLAAIRLVSALRNRHTSYFDNAFYASRPWRAPFDLQYVQGGWIVTGSRTKAVRDGTRLVSVDAESAELYFREHDDLVFASSERDARSQMLSAIFCGTRPGGKALLRFDDGTTIALDNTSSWEAKHATRVTSRWIVPGRVAYVAVPSFDDPSFERAAIDTIRAAWPSRALILDVRGNNGGSTPVGVAWLLADRPLPWWRESSTAPQPARALNAQRLYGPNPGAYRGRVIVLADERCVSSCEDLVMPLVVTHRARFVGTRTAGSTGMPFITEIAKGATLRVGSVRESFPDGRTFEGVGIAPTDPVPLTVADVRAHRDAQLARAVAIAEAPR